MSNQMTVIDVDSPSNLPARLQNRQGAAAVNNELGGGVGGGYPVISIKGKVFHVIENKTRTMVTLNDGRNSPAPAIEMVILKTNPMPSKLYYKDGYVEGNDSPPDCHSDDGIVPNADSKALQAPACAACQWNEWGSKPSAQSPRGKACSDVRRLAVAPAGQIDRPMLIRVPPGSLSDLKQYGDMLSRKPCTYRDVVTRIGFDHTVAHQKLTFEPTRYLTDEEYEQAQAQAETSVVQSICGLTPRRETPAPAQVTQQPTVAALPAGRPAATAPVQQTAQMAPAAVAPAQAPANAAPGLGAPSFGKKTVTTAQLPAQTHSLAPAQQAPVAQATFPIQSAPVQAPMTQVEVAPGVAQEAPKKVGRPRKAKPAPEAAAPAQAPATSVPLAPAAVNFGAPAPVSLQAQAPVAATHTQVPVSTATVIDTAPGMDELMSSLATLDEIE